MSFRLINLAAALEGADEAHEARLMILLLVAGRRADRVEPVDGIMKLAKMDFLLRYPNMLVRVLNHIGKGKKRARDEAQSIGDEEKNTIEARMIRFRYGPWDKRYRRWLATLSARNLVNVFKEGRTVRVVLTPRGKEVAERLVSRNEFADLARRAEMIKSAVGDMPSAKLKNFIYEIAPELLSMKWGETIRL
jgi:hypothetical protein